MDTRPLKDKLTEAAKVLDHFDFPCPAIYEIVPHLSAIEAELARAESFGDYCIWEEHAREDDELDDRLDMERELDYVYGYNR